MVDSRSSRSPEVVAAFTHWLSRRVSAGARLAVGFSGGRDSAALLHLAASSPRPAGCLLSAIHVHHGLSPRADAWAVHCQALADSLGVPLTVVRVAVDRHAPEGLEAAARAARYAAFSRIDADMLLLGHHRDDQAETVLLNLLRGAGITGLAAIPGARPLRRAGGGELLIERPLLDCPRAAVDDYIADFGIPCIDDESNDDQRFARNFVRHSVMPLLASRFPAAGQRLAEVASHAASSAGLLDEFAQIDDAAAQAGRGLSIVRLRGLSDDRLGNLLRWRLSGMGARIPSSARLREALRQIREARDSCQAEVVFGEVSVRLWAGEVFFVRAAPPPVPVRCHGRDDIPWGGGRVRITPTIGAGVRAALFDATAELRLRSGGEKIALQARRPRRALKDCFQEAGVPPWERPGVPLLWLGDRLAWVGGLGAAADCLAGEGEPAMRVDWLPD